MIPPFGLVHRSPIDWNRSRARHRAKAGTHPLGAVRFRLVRVLRDLRLYEARIAARLQAEQRADERFEALRAARLEERRRVVRLHEGRRDARRQEDEWFARQLRRQRLSRLWQQERTALLVEEREFVLLLKQELMRQTMTDAQRAAEQIEEQVVAWLRDAGTSAGG